jgi:hypothetical protein
LLKQSKENEKEVEQLTVVKQEEVEKELAGKTQITRELIVEQDGMLFFDTLKIPATVPKFSKCV